MAVRKLMPTKAPAPTPKKPTPIPRARVTPVKPPPKGPKSVRRRIRERDEALGILKKQGMIK